MKAVAEKPLGSSDSGGDGETAERGNRSWIGGRGEYPVTADEEACSAKFIAGERVYTYTRSLVAGKEA